MIREAVCQAGQSVTIRGWLAQRRNHGGVMFLDISDSSGSVQVVFEAGSCNDLYEKARSIALESCVEITGTVVAGKDSGEVVAHSIECISHAGKSVLPLPRSTFDIFDEKHTDHVFRNYHLYMRNPQLIAVMRFRSELMRIIRDWFYANGFIEFNAPILTPATLYEEDTALSIKVHGENVFLTQCAGFYLEAAAQALDRVFNMGPSFRGETSRSKRHLIEYWHIKAELLYGSRNDIIDLVEAIIAHIIARCQISCNDIIETVGRGFCADGAKTPYPRISYADAVNHLNSVGQETNFGEHVGIDAEGVLEDLLGGPYWIVGIPRSVEPFPYVIDSDDNRITMVADLITSNKCGELLGVAEKISNPDMLCERMKEKGKWKSPSYDFVKDVHQAGCAPHIAFGMGLERLIRWLLNLPHVRYATAFPRLVRRSIYP